MKDMTSNNPFLKYHINLGKDNPFAGPLAESIRYDYLNSVLHVPIIEDFHTKLLPIYEFGAHYLSKALKSSLTKKPQKLLDLGCGTGASTRMLHQNFPLTEIIGVDQSSSMMRVARYKLRKDNSANDQEFETYAKSIFEGKFPEHLNSYWVNARNFINSDNKITLQESNLIELIENVGIDWQGAIAGNSLHWLGDKLGDFFQSLNGVEKGTPIVWNTASDFYNDPIFPSSSFGFRYNDLIGMVAEELQSQGYQLSDYKSFRSPTWNLKAIQDITSDNGFQTEQIGSILIKNDFQRLISLDVPLIMSGLITNNVPPISELERISREVVGLVLKKQSDFARDIVHKYEINPIFVSRRS
jgi:SAM-dependent methyltransferase